MSLAGGPRSAKRADRSRINLGSSQALGVRKGVEEVVDQWYGPNDAFFKVRASDGNLYVLRRRSSTPEGEWSLESFRDLTRGG